MTARTFRLYTLVIAVLVGGLLIWGILGNLPLYIPVIVIVVGLIIKLLIRRSVGDTLADERLQTISDRATTFSYRYLSILMAVTGLAFVIFKDSLPPEFEVIGGTLAFSVCIMLVTRISLYYIFAARS